MQKIVQFIESIGSSDIQFICTSASSKDTSMKGTKKVDKSDVKPNISLVLISSSESDSDQSILSVAQSPNICSENLITLSDSSMSSVASLNKLPNPYIRDYSNSSDSDEVTEQRNSHKIWKHSTHQKKHSPKSKIIYPIQGTKCILNTLSNDLSKLAKTIPINKYLPRPCNANFVSNVIYTNNRQLNNKKPTCKHWTREMANFYDSDVPGKLVLRDIQKQQSNCNSKWKVLPNDFSKSRRPWGQSRCSNCREFGHNTYQCTRIKHCLYCSSDNHSNVNECPENCCLLCGKEPHRYCTGAKHKCKSCQQYGHLESVCPYSWRKFHVTTSGNYPIKPVHKLSAGDWYKTKFCCNCGQAGHHGYQCKNDKKGTILAQTVNSYKHSINNTLTHLTKDANSNSCKEPPSKRKGCIKNESNLSNGGGKKTRRGYRRLPKRVENSKKMKKKICTTSKGKLDTSKKYEMRMQKLKAKFCSLDGMKRAIIQTI